MITKTNHSRKNCQYDYDYLNDIIFFKAKDREYAKSIELDNVVVDIDEEDFIVGVQTFNPSELFGLNKETLRNIRKWEFQAKVDQNRLEVKIVFQTTFRNKIIEPRPVLIEPLKQPLPNSQMICAVR